MLTAKEIATAFINALSTYVPPALSAAGLDDFEQYKVGMPADANKRIMGCYMGPEKYMTSDRSIIMLIEAQLGGVEDYEQNYHSAIWPVILEHITAELAGMTVVNDITAEPYPVEPGRGGTLNIYIISLNQELDDCDS